MKKLILSLVTMASLAFAANAVTNMCVKTADGQVDKYDVENVAEVYYVETTEAPSNQGVTVSGKVGLYTYVDLGLPSGTMWATYNVGATKPDEYGDYFAWGETKPKDDYDHLYQTYKWCKGSSSSMTKYCTTSDYGTVDNKTVLEAEDDAATANWGSAWRMPTREEIDELIDACNWELIHTFLTGIAGRLGTTRYKGATIFLPAAGYRFGTDLDAAGYSCSYWSSSLYVYGSGSAYDLGFTVSNFGRGHESRYLGHSVRAVLR